MHAVEMPGQTTEMKLLAGPPPFLSTCGAVLRMLRYAMYLYTCL